MRVAEREADDRRARRLPEDFTESKKMIWKELKRVRKGESVK